MARFHKPPKHKNSPLFANIIMDNDKEIKAFLYEHTEENYYHWHKFHRIQKPEKYSYEDFWQAITFLRSSGKIRLSL